MSLDQLIAALQEIRAEKGGDIEVYVTTDDGEEGDPDHLTEVHQVLSTGEDADDAREYGHWVPDEDIVLLSSY